MPLDEPETVMRHALYGVCTDFISKLKEGCPEVTEIVTKEGYGINEKTRSDQWSTDRSLADRPDLTRSEVFLTDKKYPSLIQVIKSMLSSPGVSSTLSGKYTLKNYAEKALLRKCIQMDMLDEL